MAEHAHQHARPADAAVAGNRPVLVETTPSIGPPAISWGAIAAGFVVLMSVAWLMNLLGIALGVSIADATDSWNIEGGLGIGATIWMVLTWFVAFFVGALVAARLAGRIDNFSGVLHGLTLWGVATILSLLLGWMGLSSILQTGQQMVSAAVRGAGYAAASADDVASVVPKGMNAAADALTSEWGRNLRSRLADQAAEATEGVAPGQLTADEIETAINDLDDKTTQDLVNELTDGDRQGAANILADMTKLSQQDARALINGVYRELEVALGNPNNNASLAEDLENRLARQVDGYVASLDNPGGADVTKRDIRLAIDDLDNRTLQTLGQQLAMGKAAEAKQTLADNTTLTAAEVEAVYEGAEEEISETAKAYREEVSEAVETTSTYASHVLWTVFASTAIALVVALAGGWLGADGTRRVYPAYES